MNPTGRSMRPAPLTAPADSQHHRTCHRVGTTLPPKVIDDDSSDTSSVTSSDSDEELDVDEDIEEDAAHEEPGIEDVQPRHVETPRPLQRLCAETLVREVAENCPETFEQVELAVHSKEEFSYYLEQEQAVMWSTELVDRRLFYAHMDDPRVPWHLYGDVALHHLIGLGLKERDYIIACQWQDGFSNLPTKRQLEERAADGENIVDPKLILRAEDVFKRSSKDGRVSVQEKSDFVQNLRGRYSGQVAERILRYLERQYEEWLSCALSHGSASRKVSRKMADGQHRELRLHEKLELLFALEAPVRREVR